jgi:4-diphosphocytidyl-2-C-methyl-D-erythritol kinase
VPAKVNLQLAVGPARPDGYHGVVTVYQAISLYDEVTVRAAERTTVQVTGQDAELVPTGSTNLASKAVTALARAAGLGQRPGVAIEIRKRIPMAAGLAGGSADAAATLVACNELWQAGLSQAQLAKVAARLGSDVPFSLVGGTAVGQGRGELLTPALVSGTYYWVLAFAAGGLSTPEVYATCDRLRAARLARQPESGPSAAGQPGTGPSAAGQPGTGPSAAGPAEIPAPELSGPLMTALRSGDPVAVGQHLTNDLQPAAVSMRPDLRRALTAGREFGAVGAMVSGSGPTCLFLAKSSEHARELAVSLTGAGICRAVALASGPVPGAALVSSGVTA